MNEDNTKVVFTYDAEIDFLELTPEQMRLLDYLQENNYLVDFLEIKVNPEYEKI